MPQTASIATIKESIASITRHSLRFCSGTVLSRVTGLIRDMILASVFGASASVAALFVAYRFSQVFRRLFGEGSFQSAFIPLFEEVRKDSEERAFYLFRDITALIALILVGIAATIMIGLAFSLKFFTWSESSHELIVLTIILTPSLIPICLYGVNMCLLQCQKQYFTPSIAPAAFNIVIALAALIFMHKGDKAAMPYLAGGIVLACAMQWAVTAPATLRHLRTHLKGKITKSISFFSQDIRRLLWPLGLGIIGVAAVPVNNAVDAILARYADVQGPAYLQYGIRFIQLPLALFGIAISQALLPPLSRAIQSNNKEEYTHYLEYATRRITAFLLPCSIVLLTFGTHIINLLFGTGHFTADCVYNTSACLQAYAIGLLPTGFVIVFGPTCYAHKEWKVPVIGSCISLVNNFVLNVLFIFVFGLGAVSVAIATSISAWLNVAYIYRHLKIRGGKFITAESAQEIFKVASASILAGITTWIIQSSFGTASSLFTYNTMNLELLSRNRFDQSLQMLLPSATFLVSLFAFAYLIKANDILSFVRRSKEAVKA